MPTKELVLNPERGASDFQSFLIKNFKLIENDIVPAISLCIGVKNFKETSKKDNGNTLLDKFLSQPSLIPNSTKRKKEEEIKEEYVKKRSKMEEEKSINLCDLRHYFTPKKK